MGTRTKTVQTWTYVEVRAGLPAVCASVCETVGVRIAVLASFYVVHKVHVYMERPELPMAGRAPTVSLN